MQLDLRFPFLMCGFGRHLCPFLLRPDEANLEIRNLDVSSVSSKEMVKTLSMFAFLGLVPRGLRSHEDAQQGCASSFSPFRVLCL